ncbi:hypothetical protein OIU85_006666 [Salix viminalis]|uniref:MADS-box domain-containing protein n=1 Tax=Salix viminalis TaxID=40686 RepID=A0A9Q0SVB4_SALVM|nr:hypothetical protein OIU85_006666 [Salix viminalis]
MVSEKPATGRRKIKIEKISKKNHLQVTFSKRRAGLFKKASELSTLCGADIAMIVFSPAQKAFSFGHPDVDSITRRFLSGSPSPPSSGLPQLIETRRNANAHDQNVELTRILDHIEAEKKYGEVLDRMRRADRSRCCWESPIEELELHELEQLRGALEELKKAVAKQVNNILIEPTSSLPFSAVNGGGDGGDFAAKLEIDNASSAALHFNNFGYAQKIC